MSKYPGVDFYHARPLAYSPYGEATQVKGADPDYECAFQWLGRQFGYYPLFLAVGTFEEAADMTGYRNQFSREAWVQGIPENHRNQVLFQYHDLPEVRFTDFSNWHLILSSIEWAEAGEPLHLREISDYIGRLVLKPSWRAGDWLRNAQRGRIDVQAHVEKLDLTQASAVWCRNQATKRELVRRGFSDDRVEVCRLKP